MAQQQRRLDRVLEPAYLEGADARSVEELRAMHEECAEIETEVSYVRRLAHARIEILEAEIDRRERGGSLGELIDALPRILADSGGTRSPAASTRLPGPLAPAMSIAWNRGMERLISDATLANLPTIPDDELTATIEQLRDLDREVSVTRKGLHQVIDALDRALAARLAVGSS